MILHQPVLLQEVKDLAAGTACPVKTILDGTFGRGGHARELMQIFPEAHLTAVDQDLEAISYGKEHFRQELESRRLEFVHSSFCDLKIDPERKFDLILLDLGVSSPQLDNQERGFSFYGDGPLDMRMDQTQSLTAAEIVNTWSEDDLADLFRTYGEIQRPMRVVRAIINDRVDNPFVRTQQLSSMIERVEGWRKKGVHPATLFFMALRLEVNRELEAVEKAIPQLMERLNPGGRLLVITFHSLEDRIVKNLFRNNEALGSPVRKKVIKPQWDESKVNPRARSAKLRVFERGPK
jgi:16S rRNA (cytosine1402-N4)-methyltransferase